MTFLGLWMSLFPPVTYLVLRSCSFLLCQEDENTTENPRSAAWELLCGKTAVRTFMFLFPD